MRRREWAASRVKTRAPASLSNSVPQSISSLMYFVPSATRTSTAFSSHSPAPAISVSSSCNDASSSSESATATPPCAYSVFDSLALSFVSTVTPAPAIVSAIAARNPATPLPITTKSVFSDISAKCNTGQNRLRMRENLLVHNKWNSSLVFRAFRVFRGFSSFFHFYHFLPVSGFAERPQTRNQAGQKKNRRNHGKHGRHEKFAIRKTEEKRSLPGFRQARS